MVQESNDLWILQIYEDGNPRCISFSELWETLAKQYGGIVKFGRVNAMTQVEVLRKLPFHIHFFPTIISIRAGAYPDIFEATSRNI